MSSRADPLSPRARLGKYELCGVIGEGALGIVHDALDPVLDRHVAIKTPRRCAADAVADAAADGGAAGDADAVASLRHRFLREARAAGRLAHPHLVAVHDFGEHAGRPFIVMERVRGRPLSLRLVAGRAQPFEQAARWALPLLEALDVVHRGGVVHRDVKPANVFLTEDGRVKLGDFGVAQMAGDEAGVDVSVPAPNLPVIGTPRYAAPEQWAGIRVSPAADLWAVGVMLYQATTGRLPFTGTLLSILRESLRAAPPPPSSLSPALTPAVDRLILHALRPAPAERPPDAAAFADAISRLLSGAAGGRAVPVSRMPSQRRREAATRLRDADALLARSHDALDSAQFVLADGALLVEGEAAASASRSLAVALAACADGLAARERDEDALDPSVREMLRAREAAARAAASAHEAMATRLQHERGALATGLAQQLDRLEERLAVLEAYVGRDARVVERGRVAGRATPSAMLWRRLAVLEGAQRQCRAGLQRVESAGRLDPSLRARAAAVGLRIASQSRALRALAARLRALGR